MARNVEIKARLEALAPYLARAERISGSAGETIEQEDVFFHGESGRLKLRIFSSTKGQLIFYQRSNQTGPKTSCYCVAETGQPHELGKVLEQAYGTRAVVKKVRRLFIAGRTRIHIDSVEGLGDFLELEVVLTDSEDFTNAREEAEELMGQLEVDGSQLVGSAYVDLLERGAGV